MEHYTKRRAISGVALIGLLLAVVFAPKAVKHVTAEIRYAQREELCWDFLTREVKFFDDFGGLPFKGWKHRPRGSDYEAIARWESPEGSYHWFMCIFGPDSDSGEETLLAVSYAGVCAYEDLDCVEGVWDVGTRNIVKGPDGKYTLYWYPWD